MRGIRTDDDIPGRDAEGAWIGTPGSRRYEVLEQMMKTDDLIMNSDETLRTTK